MSASDRLLSGKTILVTGARRGIGLACAAAMARHGASVVMNARTSDGLEAACADLAGKHGVTCYPAPFDVRDAQQVKAGLIAATKHTSTLDAIVNNAGILRDALFAMSSPSLVEEVFATNFYGVFHCAQIASRIMARQGKGSIINMSSIIGVAGNEGQSVYGASKAAVIGLTKSLAKELAPNGIRVNAIAPGFIDTDMIKLVPKEKAEQIKNGIRMGRLGTPADVAGVCVFLASDLSAYVTGQVIEVTGGMTV
jgi:3-oxoacyl-[acyl-carrier protein] reductase